MKQDIVVISFNGMQTGTPNGSIKKKMNMALSAGSVKVNNDLSQ